MHRPRLHFPTGVPLRDIQTGTSRCDAWDALEESGLVEVNGQNSASAIALGRRCFLTCSVLHQPAYAASARPDVTIADFNVWELIVFLDKARFLHVVKHPSKKDLPYEPSEPATKIWYSKPGSSSVSRSYLYALAKGSSI